MTCPHCPLRDAEAACPAVAHPRYCALLDPAHPDHDPGYEVVILARAGQPIPPAAAPIAGAVERCAGCDHEPSLARKAVNLGVAVARHVAAGMPKVDQATYEARLAVCAGCPEFTDRRTCRKCGCRMDVKAWWAEQRCPLSKWPGEAPAEPSANPEMDYWRGGSSNIS